MLGALTGTVGNFAALLAIRTIVGIGSDAAGTLHLFDGLNLSWRRSGSRRSGLQGLRRYFFLAGFGALALAGGGPLAALASISATASSSVTALGSAVFGKVAGGAVADIGTEAALHHLDFLAALRVRAEHRDRLARAAASPLAAAASASLTTAAFMPVSNTSAVESAGHICRRASDRAIAPDRRDDRLAGLRMRADLARQRQQFLRHLQRQAILGHVLGQRGASAVALEIGAEPAALEHNAVADFGRALARRSSPWPKRRVYLHSG